MRSAAVFTVAAFIGLAAAALSGCPGGGASNPARLWLAPRGSELEVQLVDHEPPPF